MADNMSFLPEDYLDRRRSRRTNLICLTLFVVVMGSVAATFFVTDKKRVEARDHHRAVSTRYEQAVENIEELDRLQVQKKEMLRKAKITAVLIERVPRSVMMAELINNMPTSLSLLEFQLETKIRATPITATNAIDKAKAVARNSRKGGDLTDAEEDDPMTRPTDVTIQLVGIAPTDVQVAQFMTALGRADLFTDVSLVFSEETMLEQETLRKFRIEMALNQDANLDEISPRRVRRDLMQNPMADTIQIESGKFVSPTETVEVPVEDE